MSDIKNDFVNYVSQGFQPIVQVTQYYPQDDDFEEYRRVGEKVDRLTPEQIFDFITEYEDLPDDWKECWDRSPIQFLNKYYAEIDDAYVYAITEEDYEKEMGDKRREELESAASTLAKRHGVGVDSFEFFRKLEEEIEIARGDVDSWENPEAKAERFMDHSYAGCKSAYWENEDYGHSEVHQKLNRLLEIQKWIAEYCPLLWAQYQEEFKENSIATNLKKR